MKRDMGGNDEGNRMRNDNETGKNGRMTHTKEPQEIQKREKS